MRLFILSLLIFSFVSVAALADEKRNPNRVIVSAAPKHKIAGGERFVGSSVSSGLDGGQSLGFDNVTTTNSPGVIVGYTTYDYQSNSRMNRQVQWRGSQMVHVIWMIMSGTVLGTDEADRGTGYNAYDPDPPGALVKPASDVCNVHERAGDPDDYSGYVSLDVDTEGKAVIANHHKEGGDWSVTLWYDFTPMACYFGAYKDRIPDSTTSWIVPQIAGDTRYIWPSHEYQVWDGDTVTHVFAMQNETDIDPSMVVYFRRLGSDTVGHWEYPPVVVDTLPVISQVVAADRNGPDVYLVWSGSVPDPDETPNYDINESDSDNGSQHSGDIFVAESNDMGASFVNSGVNEVNISQNSFTDGGWFAKGDLQALVDTNHYFHVVYNAREVRNVNDQATFMHFFGSRLLHWSNDPAQGGEVRVVADANWDPPTDSADWCHAGAWNLMSITKPQIAECDGKLYSIFSLTNDIRNGVWNDCHEDAALAGARSTANLEIYMSVSDNNGYNWDIMRNLTDTRTPSCNSDVVGNECESDHWSSMTRYGMESAGGSDFSAADIVDPTGTYTGDFFLDIMYINDKYGGGAVQDEAVWTTNNVMWMRVPCVEPITASVLSLQPIDISDPAWTKPGVQLDTIVRLQNVGNEPMTVYGVTAYYEVGHPTGWLGLGAPPTTISHLSPNYYDMSVYLNDGGVLSTGPQVVEGWLEFSTSALITGSIDTLSVSLIVADTVFFPQFKDIRTDCIRITFDNAGNIGNAGNFPDGGYNLDYFEDCDTTNNGPDGQSDDIRNYLYESSPFILYVEPGTNDTIFFNNIFGTGWLDTEGFRPLDSTITDTTGAADYQYGSSNWFGAQDTSFYVQCEYWAPSDADSCEFIVMKQRFVNKTGSQISGLYVGNLYDWDVPSDSGVRNQSGYDATGGEASLDLMWCEGYEFGTDSIANNDCILADQRLAGVSYYNGFNTRSGNPATDSIGNPTAAWFTYSNQYFTRRSGNFEADQVWNWLEAKGATFSTWEPEAEGLTNPDSFAVDLIMIAGFGKFDLKDGDTLVFVQILAPSKTGQAGLVANINKARQWIADRPYIFTWPDQFNPNCCDLPGDANNDGTVNIKDITFVIKFKYKSGDAPECMNEADTQDDGTINIKDITNLIKFKYKGGDAPICGTQL
jgi:hypothetical protein